MRKDGKRVKNASPSYLVGARFMNKRYDAQNMIEVDIPMEPISSYVREKRKEGRRVSHLAVILCAYMRACAEFPLLNRFFVRNRPYARKEFVVCMVVLKPNDDEGTTSKVTLEFEDDIFTVEEKLSKFISDNRASGDTNSTDSTARLLVRIPGLLTAGIGLFRFLDRYGLLPQMLIDASPFHASVLVSNLASIGTNHIFHHCYHFGTTSLSVTIGVPKEVPRRHGDTVRFERCLPLGVAMDERICSGSYFAAAFSRCKEYLADPSLLEGPSKRPIIREWAKPGEYEAFRAKRIFAEEKASIKVQGLSKEKRKDALRIAAQKMKSSRAEARAIKKAAKKEVHA